MGWKLYFFILAFCVMIPSLAAKQGHVPLIAVSSFEDGTKTGTLGDLYLEIRPGQGRVFLDTFPLTKTGTQISMRFAQQIACNYVEAHCEKYDFIYTIRANSGLVTGPSAGAVATVLTIATLQNKPLKEHVALTGTINSGGYIGPVGNVKEKIDAAKAAGLNTVLIPKGDRYTEADNQTLDLVAYGKNLDLDIIEIADLDEAVWYFLGEKKPQQQEVILDPQYQEVMKRLSEKLCNRTKLLHEMMEKENATERSDKAKSEITLLLKNAEQARNEGKAYAAASFCFRANIMASSLLYELQTPTPEEIEEKVIVLQSSMKDIEEKIDGKEIKTVNDLQTYMIVKERLKEAKEYLEAREQHQNDSIAITSLLALAGERLYAAVSWSEFFSGTSSLLNMDKIHLEQSCKEKLAEAEERYNYMSEYFSSLDDAKTAMDTAFQNYQEGDFALCFFRAAKVKAEINVLINLIGVRDDQVYALLEQKLRIAKKVIAEQEKEGNFPIVGYSYYEYATALAENDLSSALLFAEYALELSNMDLYFPKKTTSFALDPEILWPFLLGLGLGILLTTYLLKPKKEEPD